jgi:hypothetical protein
MNIYEFTNLRIYEFKNLRICELSGALSTTINAYFATP